MCQQVVYNSNTHAPVIKDNKRNQKVKIFWEMFENELKRILEKHVKILLAMVYCTIRKEGIPILGSYPAYMRTNIYGQRLINMCRFVNLRLMFTNFKKVPKKQKTCRPPNPKLGEFQIDCVAIYIQRGIVKTS